MERLLADHGRCSSQLTPAEVMQIIEAYETKDDQGGWAFTTTEIAKSFNLRFSTIVTQVVKGSGRPTRFESEHGYRKPGNGRGRTNGHRQVDLDAELEAARRKVTELEARKAERAIRFEWGEDSELPGDHRDGIVIVYGVTPTFVKAGGMQRLLTFIEKECPQVKLGVPNGRVAQ